MKSIFILTAAVVIWFDLMLLSCHVLDALYFEPVLAEFDLSVSSTLNEGYRWSDRFRQATSTTVLKAKVCVHPKCLQSFNTKTIIRINAGNVCFWKPWESYISCCDRFKKHLNKYHITGFVATKISGNCPKVSLTIPTSATLTNVVTHSQ